MSTPVVQFRPAPVKTTGGTSTTVIEGGTVTTGGGPFQPLDDDLTQIAGQTTTALGRAPLSATRQVFSDADTTVNITDIEVAQIGTMSASHTVVLPAAATVPTGWSVMVYDASGTVTATNTLLVSAIAGDTINDAVFSTVFPIATGFGWGRFVSDGTGQWEVTGVKPISDVDLGGGGSSNNYVPTQLAAKTYVDNTVAGLPEVQSSDPTKVSFSTGGSPLVTTMDVTPLLGLDADQDLLLPSGLYTATADEYEGPSPRGVPNGHSTGGGLTGGILRPVTAVHIHQDYDQTADPVDPVIGSPLLIDWRARIQNAGGIFGPSAATGLLGPRGTIAIEGLIEYQHNASFAEFTPMSVVNSLMVRNDPGNARTITPGWGHLEERVFVADGATVTLDGPDMSPGTSAFVDSTCFFTNNSGHFTYDHWAGGPEGFEWMSFASQPFLSSGNMHIAGRVAFAAFDYSQYLGVNNDFGTTIGGLYDSTSFDAGIATVDRQWGFRCPHLANATVNIGLENGSATVWTPNATTLSSATNQIPCDATVQVLVPGSNLVLTSTPTVKAGTNGQVMKLWNLSTHTVTLQDKATHTGTDLNLNSPTRVLAQGEQIDLYYSDLPSGWFEVGASNALQTYVDNSAFATISGTDVQHALDAADDSLTFVGAAIGGLRGTLDTWDATSGNKTMSDATVTEVAITVAPNAARTLTLVTAAAAGAGHRFTLYDYSNGISATNNILVSAHSGGDAITNAAFGWNLLTPGSSVTLESDGVNSWSVLGGALLNPDATLASNSDVQIASQKATKTYVDPKTTTITSNATWSPVCGVPDSVYTITAQAAAVTSIANPSGTPVNGHRLTLRVKGDATPRAISGWGSQYRAGTTTAFPTTTIASKTSYYGFTWNSTDSKWDLRSVSEGY